MMNATAPITGGMSCPPMEAVASTAPAKCARKPVFFMRGIVKEPTVTTLAIAEPLTMPRSALENTATLAGPPLVCPTRLNARSEKKEMIPACSRKAPSRMNRKMYVEETPRGIPKIPSVVRYMYSAMSKI